MRRAIPGAARIAAIVLTIAPLGLCVACSTIIDVNFDEREDFSRFHTWSWNPRAAPVVETPGRNAAALDAGLSRLVGQGLEARGYVRSRRDPDLLVTCQLSHRRRTVLVQVPRAPYLLSSHHSSASYWIEGSDTEEQVQEDLRLWVDILDAEGRVVWRGALQRPVRDGVMPALEGAVATLLERLPAQHEVDER